MEYRVSRISYLLRGGTRFVVLPEAHCWQGSDRYWSHLTEQRFSSRIFISPRPLSSKEANTG
eukprot:11908632-Alexandrium_andersonii.AAC.1